MPVMELRNKIRRRIQAHSKSLLDFDKKSHEIYRNWYVDGRTILS
jgi:hypothetical protein